MKILFFFVNDVTLNIFTKIEADLLMNHTLNGDDIYIVKDFDGNIGKSQMSYPDNYHLYRNKKVFNNLIGYLEKQGAKITLLDYKEVSNFEPKEFDNIQSLKDYSFEGYKVGQCVAATTISLFRDHKVNTIKNKKFINRELKNALDVLETIKIYQDLISPDLCYLFNGKTSIFGTIVLYCKKNKLPFRTYETTYRYGAYHLLENATPFDLEYHYEEMMSLWRDTSVKIEEKIEIANSFFENQRKGKNELEPSYIQLQKKELDKNLIKGKEVITFFNSSIDEFASVPGWGDYVYIFGDEIRAIESICSYYKNDKNKIFILRIHPNLKYLRNTQNRELQELKRIENLIVIEPHSPILSYSLLDISDKIITFGSTIGVEACYYGKPIICLGMAYYKYIEVAYSPKDEKELYSFISERQLEPKPKQNTLLYGYWAKTFGNPFANFVKGYISVDNYKLTTIQKIIAILLKTIDLLRWKNLKRGLKIFNPKYSIFKKIKDPIYRRGVLKALTPWE